MVQRLLNWKDTKSWIDSVAWRWSSVTSGVPQGSILGPMLLVLFINELPNITPEDSDAALYTKIFQQITSEVDAQNLQQTITHLSCWTNTNNIQFNESKCKMLSVSRKNKPITFIYQLGSSNLHRVRLWSRNERSDFFLQSSLWYNRIVKLWNDVCRSATPDTFPSLRTFKNFLLTHHTTLTCSVFDVNLLCAWSRSRECPRHRNWIP